MHRLGFDEMPPGSFLTLFSGLNTLAIGLTTLTGNYWFLI